jgi:penicillin-binding protein 1C
VTGRVIPALTVALCALMAAETAAAGLDLAFPPPMGKIEHASVAVLDRQRRWLGAMPVENGRWRLKADLARIDPAFVRRMKAIEDARFDAHPGIDPAALVRAGLGDLAAGRIRSGGSTLTMQLARRLQPRPRTLAAKFIEAARALQLEARLGKGEVLADYLTLAPYGGNLEGVRAASLAYFGHEPDRLSDAEQALLIALPQAPEARRPDRHPRAALVARREVLARLKSAGLISAEDRLAAEAEPLPTRKPIPNLAWQATRELAAAARPGQATVVSTLDARLQDEVQALAAQTAAAQGDASQAAVLVVDVRTGAVRASVASAGRDRPGGWIDNTRTLRSPGSALKPFIYAMAFETGLASAGSRIEDAPRAFADYRPRDFDRAFRGEVTVGEALRDSLNAPAVSMLSQVGASDFEERLRSAGVTIARPYARLAAPSLAIALGGEGVSLRDLARLYAALANDGLARPLVWSRTQSAAPLAIRLVRSEAAAEVLAILKEGEPPPGRARVVANAEADRIAFKTGTSYGYRDAVAVGVADGCVVAVWTGRADAGARPGLTGRAAALPLLFSVFDQLRSSDVETSPLAPGVGAPPAALADAAGAKGEAPEVFFPPDAAQLPLDDVGPSGLILSGHGRGLRWYVDGAPIGEDRAGQAVWRPNGPGFFRIVAVDQSGVQKAVRVRVVR